MSPWISCAIFSCTDIRPRRSATRLSRDGPVLPADVCSAAHADSQRPASQTDVLTMALLVFIVVACKDDEYDAQRGIGARLSAPIAAHEYEYVQMRLSI